jgi:hypothetical protein
VISIPLEIPPHNSQTAESALQIVRKRVRNTQKKVIFANAYEIRT